MSTILSSSLPTIKTDQETFEAMVKTTQKFFPKYKVIAKANSKLHKAIGYILKPFCPGYLTRFWTYFGNRNAYPIEGTPGEHFEQWKVHIHEGTHAAQEKRFWGPLWGSLYLLGTPVYAIAFALLSIPFFIVGALVSSFPWWSGFIVLGLGIALSSPIPFAYWRSEWELQGYGASIAVKHWTTGKVSDAYIEAKVDTFTGGDYFYMCVFPNKVRKRLKKARRLAQERKFIMKWLPYCTKFYASCYQTLKNQGRIKIKNKVG